MLFKKRTEIMSHCSKRMAFYFLLADEVLGDELQLNKKEFFKFQSKLRFGQGVGAFGKMNIK